MNTDIKNKLLTIMEIASLEYPISDKQKGKIKYLAKDMLLSAGQEWNEDADCSSFQKALVVRLRHVHTELSNLRRDSYERLPYYQDALCQTYQKYLELISRIHIEHDVPELAYDKAPPTTLFENWNRKIKEEN